MRPGVATASRFLSKILGSLVLVVIVVVVASVFMLSPLGMSWLAKWMGAEYKTGIDAAKLVYSWPTVAAVCILAALGLFRDPLRKQIGKLESFKVGPVEVRARMAPSTNLRDDLLKRIRRWEQQEGNLAKTTSFAQSTGKPSATLWKHSAPVSELEELIEMFEIP